MEDGRNVEGRSVCNENERKYVTTLSLFVHSKRLLQLKSQSGLHDTFHNLFGPTLLTLKVINPSYHDTI